MQQQQIEALQKALAAQQKALEAIEAKSAQAAAAAPQHATSPDRLVASGAPMLWVALRPTGAEPPYQLFGVTADPAEGEAWTEAGNDLVDVVPMPERVRETI